MSRRAALQPFLAATAVVLCGSLAMGAPPEKSAPMRLIGVLDGPPAMIEIEANGTVWASWAWRAGREFDLALARRDGEGLWSRPNFLGRGDGIDQVEPTFASDLAGNLYLAFAERPTGRLMLAVLPAGFSEWSIPVAVGPAGVQASSPAMRVVGDRLVLAYRVGGDVDIRVLPLWSVPEPRPLGIQDGPDPVGPSGAVPTGGGSGDEGGAAPVGD